MVFTLPQKYLHVLAVPRQYCVSSVSVLQTVCVLQCDSRGELLVSLSYQPVSHRLSVVVLKARHLPKMDMTGLSASK